MSAPERPCEVWGGCEAPGVRRFQHTTLFGDPVSLWACREHARWWRERHPEVDATPTMR